MTEYNDEFISSKTQQKKADTDLQALGLSLMDLKEDQRARLPLTDDLIKAMEDAKRITSNEARRRHAQYIGRLMRESDSDHIIAALDTLMDPFRQQRLTNWTDQLASSDTLKSAESVIEQVLTFFPHGDRQQLRNLTRNILKAKTHDPANARKEEIDRFKRERRKVMSYLNQLDKTAPLY